MMLIDKSRYGLTGLLASLLLLGGCAEEAELQEVPLRAVRTITVSDPQVNIVRSFTGVSESSQVTSLSFRVGGTITALNVAIGDRVDQGQVIAQIEPSTLQLQLQQAQADLARATAEQRNAEAAYERIRGLYANQSASRDQLDTARAGAESARALVNASARAVELARLNLSYATLRSNADCSVADTSAEVGENVSPSQEVARLNCGASLNIDVSVPESMISNVKTGMTTSVQFDAVPDRTFDGTVTEVGISAQGTTFPVTVNVIESGELRSGLSAQVDFSFDNASALPVLPSAAVLDDKDGRFVYVLTPGEQEGEGVVRRQPVSVGDLGPTGIEIVEGIKAGDRVVTAGVSVIRDGLRVSDPQ